MAAIMWEILIGLFLDIFIPCMQGEYSGSCLALLYLRWGKECANDPNSFWIFRVW